MAWGSVEIEDEVDSWLRSLPGDAFGRAQFYIDLLEREGPLLGEPYSRQLRGKLRELRFYLATDSVRLTYYLARGKRIILLTVFKKTQRREEREIERAERAMQACIDAGHSAEEDAGG